MTSVIEYQYHIISENQRKQDELKNILLVNALKIQPVSPSKGDYFRILSDTDTTEDTTDSFLQDILSLSSYILKDAFFQSGVNIGDLPYLRKNTAIAEIT